jgi:hypothetical protein
VSDLRSNQLLVGNWHSYQIQDRHDIRQDKRMRPQRRGELCGSGSATLPMVHYRTSDLPGLGQLPYIHDSIPVMNLKDPGGLKADQLASDQCPNFRSIIITND